MEGTKSMNTSKYVHFCIIIEISKEILITVSNASKDEFMEYDSLGVLYFIE